LLEYSLKSLQLYYLTTATAPANIIALDVIDLLTSFVFVFLAGGAAFMTAPQRRKLIQSDMEKI